MSEQLLPCPFCGGADIGHKSEDEVAIVCLDCFGCGPSIEGSREDAATWDRARTAWNRRAAPALQAQEGECPDQGLQ